MSSFFGKVEAIFGAAFGSYWIGVLIVIGVGVAAIIGCGIALLLKILFGFPPTLSSVEMVLATIATTISAVLAFRASPD